MAVRRTATRAVFIGQRNFYTDFLCQWLAERLDLVGIVWTASERHKRSSKIRFFLDRVRRFGVFQALSELLYWLGISLKRRRDGPLLKRMIEEARRGLSAGITLPQAIETPNLKAPGVLEYLRRCRPDIILTQCINEFIPAAVYSLPRVGCFVYHEGIVPKYRGKYGTHWAILNGEFDQIGASLIKVGPGYDAGEVAFTHHVRPRGRGFSDNYWEHEVLYLALPRLEQWIYDLADGRAELRPQTGKYPIYSYGRLSHLFRIGRCVERYEAWRAEQEKKA